MTDKQICKYHKFDKDNWEHLCTEFEVVCMGNERDQKYCYLVQRDKYKQAFDEIENYCNTILKDYLKYSQACINITKEIKDIITKAKDVNNE